MAAANDMTRAEQRQWREQAREVVRKAKARVGRDGWAFVGREVQDALIDSEVLSVVTGWANMEIARPTEDAAGHMATCIRSLRRAVSDEIDAEREEG